MECERGEQGGNGTSIQRSKFRAFHNLIVRKKFGALAVVHNLFSSIESLHTSSSKQVLALKDNTPRFLRLFQLRNRRGAQILLFNASTLLVRSLLEGKGKRMEQLVQGLFPFRIRSQDIFSQNLENITLL